MARSAAGMASAGGSAAGAGCWTVSLDVLGGTIQATLQDRTLMAGLAQTLQKHDPGREQSFLSKGRPATVCQLAVNSGSRVKCQQICQISRRKIDSRIPADLEETHHNSVTYAVFSAMPKLTKERTAYVGVYAPDGQLWFAPCQWAEACKGVTAQDCSRQYQSTSSQYTDSMRQRAPEGDYAIVVLMCTVHGVLSQM